MRSLTAILTTLLFAASAVAASSMTVPLPERAGSIVSATGIRDDATAWIAIATPEPWRTEVLRVSPDGTRTRIAVPDGIVKDVQPLTDGRLALTVAEAGGPSFRVVDRDFRVQWSSRLLPARLFERAGEHLVRFSSDGSRWALLAFDDNRIAVTVGSTGSHVPETTTTLRADAGRPHGVYDSVDVAFTSPEDLAVLWRGRIYVLDKATTLAKTLAPAAGGAFLEYDAGSRTLWAFTPESASAFRLDAQERRPVSIGPGRQRRTGITSSRSGSAWLELRPGAVTVHRR